MKLPTLQEVTFSWGVILKDELWRKERQVKRGGEMLGKWGQEWSAIGGSGEQIPLKGVITWYVMCLITVVHLKLT